MSFDDGFILGLSLGESSGGGGGDDCPPSYLDDPDYALYQALPEPASNQIIMLCKVLVDGTTAQPVVPYLKGGFPKDDSVQFTVDYGNGFSRDFKYSDQDQYCVYEKAGNYVVTVTKENPQSLLTCISDGQGHIPGSYFTFDGFVIAVKCGSDMVFADSGYDPETGSGRIQNYTHKKYMKFNSGYIWNDDFTVYGNRTLLMIDCTAAPSKISAGKFSNSTSLDFTNLTKLFADVAEIGVNAFSGCQCLRKAKFPSCVSVGEGAFDSCYSLEKLSLPECTSLSKCCRNSCYSLKTIELPKCVSISQSFSNSSTYALEAAELPECTSISQSFTDCYSLSCVNAPKCTSVTSSFNNCYSLNSVTLAENCETDSDSFAACYCLIPAPNGRIT